MKKVLLLSAMGLLIGLSQCTKPEVQEIAGGGEAGQHVVLQASIDGNSKVTDVSGLLKWVVGDVINAYQNGNPVGTFTCTDAGKGTFVSYNLTATSGAGDLTFKYGTYRNPSDYTAYANQDGTLNTAVYLEGTSEYKDDGNYKANMTMPGQAVLKLDLRALSTASLGTTVTITAGESTIASVSDVTTSSTVVYVAMPANSTLTEYTFSGNSKTVKKTWTLQANTFYTADNGSGGGTGEAIVIEPTLYLPGVFTVGETSKGDPIKVRFSRGNLYWDGAFKMESNQWEFQPTSGGTWVTNHVSHFFWQPYSHILNSYESSYDGTGASAGDIFFTNRQEAAYKDEPNPSFTVEGETGTWRTLSATAVSGEWYYLLNTRKGTYNGESDKDAGYMCGHGRIEVSADVYVNGLILLPDVFTLPSGLSFTSDESSEGYNANTYTTAQWSSMEDAGAVFLPAAGYRLGTNVYDVGSCGEYWSSTPDKYDWGDTAEYMYFISGSVYLGSYRRFNGYAVRLVRSGS